MFSLPERVLLLLYLEKNGVCAHFGEDMQAAQERMYAAILGVSAEEVRSAFAEAAHQGYCEQKS